MRIRVRKAMAYLLVGVLMATGISRAAVSAEQVQSQAVETSRDVGGHHHGHHRHTRDSDEVGTWQCLKYCVERAPDAGMIMIAGVSELGVLEHFGLAPGSAFQSSPAVIETAHRIWPRGPPHGARHFVLRKRHDILLRTARLRI